MTPEQEARHVLTYGGSRDDLSHEGQEAYDRMKGGFYASTEPPREAPEPGPPRAPGPEPPREAPGSDRNFRGAVIDAKVAWNAGRKVYIARIPLGYDRIIAAGSFGMDTPASIVEAIEDIGWQLDQMSWTDRDRSGLRAAGIFLFRRQ
jgi:hypothetical protein